MAKKYSVLGWPLERDVAWIDLVQLSSKSTNHAVIDQDMLNKINCKHNIVVDYVSWLSKYLDLGLVEFVRPLLTAKQVSMYKLKGDNQCSCEFIVMEGWSH